jgi:hypothetical protein
MSEFWGYPGADYLAIVIITALSLLCLYNARTWVKKL